MSRYFEETSNEKYSENVKLPQKLLYGIKLSCFHYLYAYLLNSPMDFNAVFSKK